MEFELDMDQAMETDLAALEQLPAEQNLTGGGVTTGCDWSTLIDVQC